ncbi:Bax inhibitor-1/YccA family protein [Sphingorhabdus sp.]|jgi:FtsH-binding integral membrane protein|uniref:Bax inhibitor-1/YccA family protein n=1 Tax=Sphingorhabdus sp. TaxID=1902408 RepID=UPI0035B3E2ED|nr:Bax inhibitor-1/YccA family protein [Sphingomonadaceae bacterium]
MAEWSDPRVTQNHAGVTIDGKPVASTAVDAGLRAHMLKVYNYMTSGVLLTGIVALLFANSGMAAQVMATPLRWLIILSPLAFIMVMSFGINKLSTGALQAMFWAFAAVMGLSMSTIFLVYSGESIARTFFVTAAAFASLSLWGYTTKKDLTGWGSFLIMGVVGLLLASLVNIFLGSSTMGWVISFLGVLIFAGLTAYDTQRIKSEYFYFAGHESLGKIAIMGALNLYLDFVNMFQFLLSFLGSRD